MRTVLPGDGGSTPKPRGAEEPDEESFVKTRGVYPGLPRELRASWPFGWDRKAPVGGARGRRHAAACSDRAAVRYCRPMRAAEVDLASYDTDKSAGQLANYEREFPVRFTDELTLLELGVQRGGSMYLWRDLM